ncbi:hypothetical protein K8I28_13530, partial [bacterium]|nr:hypothetical protein [bacterium]
MRRIFLLILALSITGIIGIPGNSQALTIGAGYLVPNFQVFPIGSFVDPAILNDPDVDLDFETMPRFFYLEMQADPAEYEDTVMTHLELRLGNQMLIDYYSDPFQVGQWVNRGNRLFNDEVMSQDWYHEGDETSYAEVEDILGEIVGGFMRTSTYFLTFEVYQAVNGVRGPLLQTVTRVTQIYNPSNPSLITPSDFEEISSTPILFQWSWDGGPTSPADWILIVVEGDEGEDGDDVIRNRTLGNTRYEGHPTAPTLHAYSGIGNGEQTLSPGNTYYWQVVSDIRGIVPDDFHAYESEVFSFI